MLLKTLSIGSGLVAVALCVLALSDRAENKKHAVVVRGETEDRTVTVARLPLSMYAINAAFVEVVAEREGFDVEYLDGVHPDLFPALADGRADILTSIWLPYGHDNYWAAHKDDIITLGAIFQNDTPF